MAKKAKQEVLLPYDFLPIFEKLVKSGKEKAAAEVVIAIIRYDRDGTDPVFDDEGVGFVWDTVIKPKLDENKRAYEEVGAKRRAAANSRYKMQMDANGCKSMQMDANAHDNDNDNDNDNLKTISNNNHSESNIQPSVDNSVDNSMDGMGFYKLSSKDAFEMFRQKYPRRQGALRDVQTAWVNATVGSHILPGDLVTAAERYAEECRANGTEARFIKMPQNFISSGTWKQYAPKYLPSCPRCHGQAVYEKDGKKILCDCDRRYG